MKTLLSVLLIAIPLNASAAGIYKTVDKDGNVVFTDVPPKEDAKAVQLRGASVYAPQSETTQPAPINAAPSSPQPGDLQDSLLGSGEDSAPVAVTAYEQLSIASPAEDEAVRANAGNFTVTVRLTPALMAGDQVVIMLDGQEVARSSGTAVALENIDRGTHSLMAQIVDSSGVPKIASNPVTFHLLRRSVLNRAN